MAFTQSMDTFYPETYAECVMIAHSYSKMVAPRAPLTFLAISSLSWASDACSLSLSTPVLQLFLCDHTVVREDVMVY